MDAADTEGERPGTFAAFASRDFRLLWGGQTISFAAVPDASELLFTISSRRGRAILDRFRIVAHDSAQAPAHRREGPAP